MFCFHLCERGGATRGNPSIIARNLEKTDSLPDLSDYIPVYEASGANDNASSFDPIRDLIKELETRTGTFTAGKLVDEVYGNAGFFQKFVVAPGNDKPHYGRQGGLLANTVRLVDSCLMSAESYELNEQEKISSCLHWHCFAVLVRLRRMSLNCMPTTTKKGILLGMNNLTMNRVVSALKRVVAALAKENKAVDTDAVVRIMHAITAHDGSGVKPMTKEAMVLNAAYNTDAEIVNAMDFISSDSNLSDEFTAYDPSTGRKYYTGKRQ